MTGDACEAAAGATNVASLYPARGTLGSLLDRVDAGNIDDAEEQRLLGRLSDVVDAGLDLQGTCLATEAFFRLPTCRDQDSPQRGARWIERAERGGWVARLALLPGDRQYRHLHNIDAEWLQVLSDDRNNEGLIASARRFVETHPVPAWGTAEMLVRCLWQRVDRERSGELRALLELIADAATAADMLWMVRQFQDDFAVAAGMCRARLAARGYLGGARSPQSEFDELRGLDETFEAMFGRRCAIYVRSGLLRTLLTGGSDESARRAELGNELLRRLSHITALYLAGEDDPFVRWYLQYMHGRIKGATGDIKGAIKCVRAAAALGVCRNETVPYLVGLLHVQDRAVEARTLLEDAARAEARQVGPDGSLRPTTFEGLYQLVGGDPARLPRTLEPPSAFVAWAEQNRNRGTAQQVPQLEARRVRAVAQHWAQRQQALISLFGRLLRPDDFDEALGEPHQPRTIQIAVDDAARTGLDEVPLPAAVDRRMLLAAVAAPTAASAVARVALGVTGGLEAGSERFIEIARRLPALAASPAVAAHRAQARLGSAQPSDVLGLADEYANAHGAPGEAVARLFAEVQRWPIAAGLWRELLARGTRLIGTMTGAPRAALVATLAALLTERLGDVASGAAWPEVIDALLVLEPGDGTERRLCAWHAARMERPDHADVQRAGEYLIARLAPTHGAVVREQAQTALIARAGTQPIADALVLVDAAIRLGAPGAAAADGLAAWYLARGNDRHDEMAALGERLVDWLPSPAATTVRPRVVAHLRARVSAAHGRSARIGALQRLLRMATDDRAAQTQLATEQGARRRLRLQVGAVAAVVALVAILIVWGMP